MEIGFNSINSIDNKKIKINNTNNISKLNKANFQLKDDLELSSTAKDYSVAMKSLKEIPDVREDVVAKFKEQINSGSYKISPEAVADKLVSGWLS